MTALPHNYLCKVFKKTTLYQNIEKTSLIKDATHKYTAENRLLIYDMCIPAISKL